LEVSGDLVDRERVQKKMTKTVGQRSIRQEKAQCNMPPVSNLPDKALACERKQGLKWSMLYIQKHHSYRRVCKFFLFAFVNKFLCVLCASAVSLLLKGYWIGGIAIDVHRKLPEEAVWMP
jgi:hypothetical protein